MKVYKVHNKTEDLVLCRQSVMFLLSTKEKVFAFFFFSFQLNLFSHSMQT